MEAQITINLTGYLPVQQNYEVDSRLFLFWNCQICSSLPCEILDF